MSIKTIVMTIKTIDMTKTMVKTIVMKEASQKLYRSFTEASQKLHRCITEALQKLHRSFTEDS